MVGEGLEGGREGGRRIEGERKGGDKEEREGEFRTAPLWHCAYHLHKRDSAQSN